MHLSRKGMPWVFRVIRRSCTFGLVFVVLLLSGFSRRGEAEDVSQLGTVSDAIRAVIRAFDRGDEVTVRGISKSDRVTAWAIAARFFYLKGKGIRQPDCPDEVVHREDLGEMALRFAELASEENSLCRRLPEAVLVWQTHDAEELDIEQKVSSLFVQGVRREKRPREVVRFLEERWSLIERAPEKSFARVLVLHLLSRSLRNTEEWERCLEVALILRAEAEDLGRVRFVLASLHDVAVCYLEMANPMAALECARQMLHRAEEWGCVPMILGALKMCGLSAIYQGQYGVAQGYLERLLDRSLDFGDRRLAAGALANLGECSFNFGKYKEAQARFERVLGEMSGFLTEESRIIVERQSARVMGQLGETTEARRWFDDLEDTLANTDFELQKAWIRVDRAHTYSLERQLEKALLEFLEAYPTMQALASGDGQYICEANLGTFYLQLGMSERAIDYLRKARKGFQERGDRGRQIRVELRIACYEATRAERNHEKAVGLLRTAFLEASELGLGHAQADALAFLSIVYSIHGDLPQALLYELMAYAKYESLGLVKAVFGREEGEAVSDSLLAMETLKAVSRRFDSLDHRYGTLWASAHTAHAHVVRGELREAERICQDLLPKLDEEKHAFLLGLVRICLARVYDRQGGLEEAIALYDFAIDSLGSDTSSSMASALAYAARAQTSVRQGKKEEATRDLENAIAILAEDRLTRGLVEGHLASLASSLGLVEVSLGHARRSLVDLARSLDDREGESALRVRNVARSFSDQGEEAVLALLRSPEVGRKRRQTLAEEALWFADMGRGLLLARQIGGEESWKVPSGVELAGELKRLLSPTHAFLTYHEVEDGLLVVVARHDRVEVFELPSLSEVEVGPREYLGLITSRLRSEERAARDLYDGLIRPFRTALEGCREITVAPDRELHGFPFSVLMDESGRRMIESFTFRYVVSPSVWINLESRQEREPRRNWRNRSHLVVGDPPGDENQKNEASRQGSKGSAPSLPGSGWEVRALATILDRDRTRLLIGTQATRKRVLDELDRGGPWGMLHFSCHGRVFGTRQPGAGLLLAGGEVLDLETLGRRRIGASLCVLATCNSGLGAQVKGEGRLGPVHTLFRCGIPRVLAASWRISDRSTSLLMTSFSRSLMEGGLAPAQALRQAQIRFIRSEDRKAHPYFWAPFLLWGVPEPERSAKGGSGPAESEICTIPR